MLNIDGTLGEGGGQILRSSLALSALTGQAFTIDGIRAKRSKPGLLRQHLTAVEAAARVCSAHLEGAAMGSTRLTFEPGPVVPGTYSFAVGTAGSATLVIQAVLPPLLTAPGPSRVTVEGGTHNRAAPPYDFLEKTFLPLIGEMGPRVSARLEHWGFFPAGGGRIVVEIAPATRLQGFERLAPEAVRRRRARAVVANLPRSIAERELKVVQEQLGLEGGQFEIQEPKGGATGNVLLLELETDRHCEIVTGFGAKGVSAEVVAAEAVREAKEYLEAGQPIGVHLADQLLIPLAMAGAGAFRTGPPSLHTLTNVEVVKRFLPVPISCAEAVPGAWEVRVG